MKEEIDQIIPECKVIADARAFLEECNWALEIEEATVQIPKGTELCVQTRAIIYATAPDIFLGNHYEAVVMLGCEKTEENWFSKYGYLKMYYDKEGNFISEDRYPQNIG